MEKDELMLVGERERLFFALAAILSDGNMAGRAGRKEEMERRRGIPILLRRIDVTGRFAVSL